MAHKLFVVFLIMVGITATLAVGIDGFDYYLAPQSERAFMPEHKEMKPSGIYSHTLGILGAGMIIFGVTIYSSRKRIRALWNIGKLSSWLEFHIFLCLLGPTLVIYHTTFKAGGIAAISLWAMLSVAGSGIIGRFLYVLIPRNIKGTELDSHQINEEFDKISKDLRESEFGLKLLASIDKNFASIQRPTGILDTIKIYLKLMRMKQEVKSMVRRMLIESDLPNDVARKLYKAASARAALIQRSVVLLQVEKLFFYWHAIHLPFTVMMFVTLIAHVGVAIWLGYHWIF
jgi:hypothetical protein